MVDPDTSHGLMWVAISALLGSIGYVAALIQNFDNSGRAETRDLQAKFESLLLELHHRR